MIIGKIRDGLSSHPLGFILASPFWVSHYLSQNIHFTKPHQNLSFTQSLLHLALRPRRCGTMSLSSHNLYIAYPSRPNARLVHTMRTQHAHCLRISPPTGGGGAGSFGTSSTLSRLEEMKKTAAVYLYGSGITLDPSVSGTLCAYETSLAAVLSTPVPQRATTTSSTYKYPLQ